MFIYIWYEYENYILFVFINIRIIFIKVFFSIIFKEVGIFIKIVIMVGKINGGVV